MLTGQLENLKCQKKLWYFKELMIAINENEIHEETILRGMPSLLQQLKGAKNPILVL